MKHWHLAWVLVAALAIYLGYSYYQSQNATAST